ncbi:MAG TPA: hypothetical protein VK835_14395, partial [Bacteroidia bacterium]|nr:hypothetical protein [Bacteroidia bacterium]
MNCRICTSPIADFFDVKEMIFGLPGIFTYGQCTTCGCVQIKTIPEQLHLFYPNNYYSLKETNPLPTQNSLKATILKARDLHYFGVKKSFFGFLINKLKPGKISSYFLPYQFIWETLLNNSDASIHDVGCGNGTLLQYFSSLGYKNLSGSDPFLDKEINYPNLKIE